MSFLCFQGEPCTPIYLCSGNNGNTQMDGQEKQVLHRVNNLVFSLVHMTLHYYLFNSCSKLLHLFCEGMTLYICKGTFAFIFLGLMKHHAHFGQRHVKLGSVSLPGGHNQTRTV